MRSRDNLIDCLNLAKRQVSRMAWAFALHLPSNLGGGASVVEREASDIRDWIDDAIARVNADAAEIGRLTSETGKAKESE